jgi:hypothetical protein
MALVSELSGKLLVDAFFVWYRGVPRRGDSGALTAASHRGGTCAGGDDCRGDWTGEADTKVSFDEDDVVVVFDLRCTPPMLSRFVM